MGGARSQVIGRSATPETTSKSEQYGTVVTNCSTVAGEIFQLKKGQKILVYQVDREKQLAECSNKGFVGWVEMNVAIVPR
jgi:hypothetical protein